MFAGILSKIQGAWYFSFMMIISKQNKQTEDQ